MTVAQSALVCDLLNSADYRDAFGQAIAEETADLKDKMRQHVKAREYPDASQAEAQITILEDFFQILERRAQYQRPAQM